MQWSVTGSVQHTSLVRGVEGEGGELTAENLAAEVAEYAFNDYSAQWSELRDRLQAVIVTEVAEFNRRARGMNVPALVAEGGVS